MPTTTELLGLAVDKNPVDFADTFNNIMMQKAAEAIDAKQVEMAQSLYGDQVEPEEDEFEDFDVDDVDNEDASDEDFDDIDLDLDDLDIEDFADAEDTE
jgi:hypothetical protein